MSATKKIFIEAQDLLSYCPPVNTAYKKATDFLSDKLAPKTKEYRALTSDIQSLHDALSKKIAELLNEKHSSNIFIPYFPDMPKNHDFNIAVSVKADSDDELNIYLYDASSVLFWSNSLISITIKFSNENDIYSFKSSQFNYGSGGYNKCESEVICNALSMVFNSAALIITEIKEEKELAKEAYSFLKNNTSKTNARYDIIADLGDIRKQAIDILRDGLKQQFNSTTAIEKLHAVVERKKPLFKFLSVRVDMLNNNFNIELTPFELSCNERGPKKLTITSQINDPIKISEEQLLKSYSDIVLLEDKTFFNIDDPLNKTYHATLSLS